MTVAPTHEPAAPATTIQTRLKRWVVWAMCAAGGMTSSLGSGKTELSMAMSNAIKG